MKLIKKIESGAYCSDSFIWWNFERISEKKWMFILSFYLFFGLLKIQIFDNLKMQTFWTNGK